MGLMKATVIVIRRTTVFVIRDRVRGSTLTIETL